MKRVIPDNSFRLPSFFAVGPPRTGTTWLHEVLTGQVNLPRYNKETRFFCTNYDKGMAWYIRHFDPSSDLVMGEVCPTYFCSQVARDRIANLVPNAKIICSFREPVARIFSLYKVKRAFARTDWSFEEALSRDPELFESSRYAYHLAEWQRLFGHDNVLPVFYHHLVKDPQSYIDRIADFIGIHRFQLGEHQLPAVNSSDAMGYPKSQRLMALAANTADWLKRHRLERVVAVSKAKLNRLLLNGGRSMPSLSRVTADRLRGRFQQEVEALERLVNEDLSSWKRPAN